MYWMNAINYYIFCLWERILKYVPCLYWINTWIDKVQKSRTLKILILSVTNCKTIVWLVLHQSFMKKGV